jgi:threonine-phosphate decarboxylase
MDFTDEEDKYSLKRYLTQSNQIFILKAFTKFYAMAGIRLGYGLCANKALLDRITGLGPAWNVSIPAQIAGVNALKEDFYRLESKRLIKRERNYLYEGLCNLGLKVFDPAANYIFFKGAQSLYEELLAKGILIRQCDNYVGLNKEFYRVAVKTRKENESLLKEIKECLRIRDGENKEIT